MIILNDDLWLCVDCTMYAANGDLPDDDRRAGEVRDGIDALGPHLVCNDEPETGDGRLEFSWQSCDACGSRLGGERTRFATLGEEITP